MASSKARAFYRFELWVLTGSILLILLAGLLTLLSYSASNGLGVLAVLLYVMARCISILGRGIRYEPKSRLLLLFLLLVGLIFVLMGMGKLFMLMVLLGLDGAILYNRYHKAK